MNKIYIASKAIHRPHWREYRGEGLPIISRWIDVDDKYSTDPEGLDYEALWDICVEDVSQADALVIYAEPDEVLKGAILELGLAIGQNKLIAMCGDLETFKQNGSWWSYRLMHDFTGHTIGYTLRTIAGGLW